MIEEKRMKTTQHVWDAIIVGTGPGGATVARELAANQKKVLILEKGKHDLSIHIPRMLRNKEMMFMGMGKTLVRGIRMGGTSILYYGTAFEPPKDMFMKFGIDLSDEIDELRKQLPIAPLQDHLIGPSAQLILETAQKLGFPWGKLDKFIFQEQCSPGYFPHTAQWNTLHYLSQAVEAGGVLVTEADVMKVVQEGNRCVGVEYIDRDKKVQVAYGQNIVLAAGGISSAQILRQSGMPQAGEGFFCDPLVLVQGIANGLKAGNEIPMAAGMVCWEEGYVLTDITLPKLVYQLFTAQALRLHRLHQHHQAVGIMVKIKDEISGRITSEGKMHKPFSKWDQQRMQNGCAKAHEILAAAGVKSIFRTAWTAAHPGGSVRIGEMVDSNLQTEIDRLYVCDASVIPIAWGLPPSMTVMALAKRLGKHLLLKRDE